MAELPDTIRAALDRRGLTHAQLAERIGMSRQNLSDRLHGVRPMTLETLYDIAGVLSIKPSTLDKRLTSKIPREDK